MRTAFLFIACTTFASALVLIRQFESTSFRAALGLGLSMLIAVAACLLRDWAKKEK